ncbi:hypothetical protein [Cryptosporangium japonicum]|uniref:SMI1/KNR4 family protein n=1 Tax=Cryptosporangium japonicum TaxID=80872 RepID=A0ABN0THC2_9ACTN
MAVRTQFRQNALVTLTAELARWRDSLVRLDAPVTSALKAGANPADIEAVLGASTPPAVLEWFQWCAGVEYMPGQTIGDSWAIPGFWPVALEDVVAIKADHGDAGSPLLTESWVPLLEDGSSDLYVAAWSGAGEPVVVTVTPEFGPPKVEFRSIDQMVAVFNECFARSAFSLDAQHQLEVDDELYAEIRQARADSG